MRIEVRTMMCTTQYESGKCEFHIKHIECGVMFKMILNRTAKCIYKWHNAKNRICNKYLIVY